MREQDLIDQVPVVFEDVTGLKGKTSKLHEWERENVDCAVTTSDGQRFVFECKNSGERPVIAPAVAHASETKRGSKDSTIVVVVVPFMGPQGEELCAHAGVNWMDLSGNARIIAPGLRVIVRGQPNRFVRRGRPRSLFAPKSARIARFLLLHPHEDFSQRQIATRIRLGEGYVSRLVHGLEAADLVVRDETGRVRARDPELLLDAWHDDYDFQKHTVHRAHVVSRNGEGATTQIAAMLQNTKMQFAATGLSAAWLYAPFAAFRTATFYVDRVDQRALEKAGVRAVESGENVWLVEPNDDGIYDGLEERNGIPCVSAVQTYLDLKGHAERAKEAGEALRKAVLKWRR